MGGKKAVGVPPHHTNRVHIDESSLAWKIFSAFVNDSQISATEDELIAYAVNELHVDASSLSSTLLESLPLVLVAFMNIWSGWHFKSEFLAGKFRKEHYFNRFNKFMAHKMKILFTTQFCNTIKGSDVQSDKRKSGKPPSKTSDIVKNPDFSPYVISIQCPAHMLNTIVFSNSGDDVMMKQHLGSTWHELSTTQLINWPHVEVTFRMQDLCFVRRQATEYIRYLNFLPHERKKTIDSVIERAETLKTYDGVKECYTYRLLEEYIREYMQAMKSIVNITETKFEEIQTIVTQFLEDVKYINVNKSMVSNTMVLFRLSPMPFIRNKKLVKDSDKNSDEARIGYCEIITPKIELVMPYFRAKQKDTPHISFELTDKLTKAFIPSDEINTVLPHIAYKCTFCRVEYKSFNGKKSMMEHLKKFHKMEQHVRCTVCKKQFDVMNLAACRWRHKCISAASASTTVIL